MTVPQLDEPWLSNAVETTREIINEFVRDFATHPYLHRVEHSVHTRLFAALAAGFPDKLPIDANGPGDAHFTTSVHKEWPTPHPTLIEIATRRGNFDFAILSPTQIAEMTLDAFLDGKGRTPADIVIEVGLDYGLGHLETDRTKLERKEVRHGFLVHLDRKPRWARTLAEVRNYVEDASRIDHIAYAYYDRITGQHMCKVLGDTVRPAVRQKG